MEMVVNDDKLRLPTLRCGQYYGLDIRVKGIPTDAKEAYVVCTYVDSDAHYSHSLTKATDGSYWGAVIPANQFATLGTIGYEIYYVADDVAFWYGRGNIYVIKSTYDGIIPAPYPDVPTRTVVVSVNRIEADSDGNVALTAADIPYGDSASIPDAIDERVKTLNDAIDKKQDKYATHTDPIEQVTVTELTAQQAIQSYALGSGDATVLGAEIKTISVGDFNANGVSLEVYASDGGLFEGVNIDTEVVIPSKGGTFAMLDDIPTVDAELSEDSTNPVQNKAVWSVLDGLDNGISLLSSQIGKVNRGLDYGKTWGTFETFAAIRQLGVSIKNNGYGTSNYATGIVGSRYDTVVISDNPSSDPYHYEFVCYEDSSDVSKYTLFKAANASEEYSLPKASCIYRFNLSGRGLILEDMFGIDRTITCFVQKWGDIADSLKTRIGAYKSWGAADSHRALVWYPSKNHPQIMTFGLMRDLYKMGYTIRIKETVDDDVRYAAFWTGAKASVPTNTYWYLSNLVETDTTALKGNGGAGSGFAWFAPIGGDTSWATTARQYRINFRSSASTKDSSYAFTNVQYQYCTMAISNFAFSGESNDSSL